VFFLPSCSPARHDYKNISVLEEELSSGHKIDLEEVEELDGGGFLYRIEYFMHGFNYTLETRSFESDTDVSNHTEELEIFALYYKDNILYGVIELLEEERGDNFLINECISIIPEPMSCFLNFNNTIKSEFTSSRFLLKPDRTTPLLKGLKHSNEGIYEDEGEDSEWWHGPTRFLLEGFGSTLPGAVFMITFGAVFWILDDPDEKVTVEIGDHFSNAMYRVEKTPIDIKYFVDALGTGLAYSSDPASVNPTFTFGSDYGVVQWTRKCVVNAPTGICPTPQIPNAAIDNQKSSKDD
jgi:hypothetical protein